MSQESVEKLVEEILDVLDSFRKRNDTTYAEAVGALEFAKLTVYKEAME